MIGAEAHAVFAKRSALRLVEPLHIFGDLLPFEHAQIFDQPVSDAATNSGYVLGRAQGRQRTEQLFDMRLEPEFEPRLHLLARRSGELLVGQHADARMHHFLSGGELADRISGPADGAVGGQNELLVGSLRQLSCARIDLAGQCLLRGRMQRLGLRTARGRIGGEAKALQPPDQMALDRDFASL